MINIISNKKSLIRLLTLPLVAFFSLSQLTLATPLSEKKARIQEIKQEINDLDIEISEADEGYNQARNKLSKIERKIDQNYLNLQRTKQNLRKNKRILNRRVRGMYITHQDSTLLEFALQTASFQDLLTGLDFIQRISKQDANIVKRINVNRKRLEQTKRNLYDIEREQKYVVRELKQQRESIEKKITQRKNILSGVESEVAALEEQENQAAALAAVQASNPSPTGAPPVIPTKPPVGGVVEIAYAQLGKPYQWAGAGPDSFDCSGLVMYVYAQVGVSLPHSSYEQFNIGTPISRENLEPGDIVFFRNPPSHEGLYIGSGLMIEAPSTGDVVKISSAFRADYSGARRP